MESKVHPAVALVVIILVVLAMGLWTWGTGQAKAIGGPAGLLVDPAGHLYIRIQNLLLEHDTDGRFIERHDLSNLGIEQVIGAIGFFSDGDMLVRRGPDPRSVFDNMRAFLRRSNKRSLAPESQDTGLHRCDLRSKECTVFGSAPIDFKAAVGLFIDRETDEVYVSDTSRHVLRKYSRDGEALAGPADGFKFPNQLLVYENRLLVADTNHHRIRAVDPATSEFGSELQAIEVIPTVAKRAGRNWPSHFARVGDEWWINIMRKGMNQGGIHIFSDAWTFDREVRLPDGADPIALLPFGGAVLINDWNNDRVWRVSADGELLGSFVSPGLAQVVAESEIERRQFQVLAYLALAVFGLVIAILLIKVLTANLPGSG